MDLQEILKHADHTLLKATSSWDEIKVICDDAIKFKTASICIPPCYVKRIKQTYGDALNICTVIGFPLGYNTTEVKAEEAKQAIAEGANEIDMVINICDVKNGDFDKVLDEIKALRAACGEKILKVIIETCYLTQGEKIKMCELVTEAKADFIKTSTGFGTAGATREDILLFKEHIGENVRIKAAGGMKTLKDMDWFVNAGCGRLGTSAAVRLIKELNAN